MSSGIRAVVKRYETEENSFEDYVYYPNDFNGIYNRLMDITNCDHEEASNGASWCEFATIGEIYEFYEGEIEIMDID